MTDDEPERLPDKPTEWAYRDYCRAVEIHADAAREVLTDYPEDPDDIHDVVRYAIEGANLVTDRGFMLVTVLLSDQDPDRPDYMSEWRQFVDFNDDELSWSGAVQQMAYVCLYSDVMDSIQPPEPLTFDSEGAVISLRCTECGRSVMYAEREQHSCVEQED